ncbi:MAG: cation transporter [Treponema sp.]|nr:cation transporter [Treponema sp.]
MSMDEKKIVSKLSTIGILGNVLLAAFKLISGILGNSGAMISDAVHPLSDVFATLIAYIGVLMSKRPEDKEHPYGHERLECVASLILGIILAVTGLGIGYTGIHKIIEPSELEVPTLLPLIAAVVSIVVKEGMFWYTMYYAKKLDSSAFKADAWHHRSDAISSVGSFIGIGLAKIGYPIMDPIASIIICLCILKVSFDITKDALEKMLDTSCSKEFEDDVQNFIKQQQGVEGIDLFHTRQFGNKVYVELEISVDRNRTLVEAHEIAETVHKNLEEQFPSIKHVMIHVNPSEN